MYILVSIVIDFIEVLILFFKVKEKWKNHVTLCIYAQNICFGACENDNDCDYR
jgi:hypothetical protein